MTPQHCVPAAHSSVRALWGTFPSRLSTSLAIPRLAPCFWPFWMGTAVLNRRVQCMHGTGTPSLCAPERAPGPRRRNAAGCAECTAHSFVRPAPSCNNALPLPRPPPLLAAPQLPRCPPRPAAAPRRFPPAPVPAAQSSTQWGGEGGGVAEGGSEEMTAGGSRELRKVPAVTFPARQLPRG